MNQTKSTVNFEWLTNELRHQLTALHHMGLSNQSFTMYCKYGELVTEFIESHHMDIIMWIDSWVNQQWQSSESVYYDFFMAYNEGEELDALRILNIKGGEHNANQNQ